MVIVVRGLFHSPASWARVNREVCMALYRRGEEVFARPDRRYGFDSNFEIPRAFDDIPSSAPQADVTIGFDHPRYYRTWRAPLRIGILTCEFTRIPREWVGEINEHLDFLILPSTFCTEVFEREGIPPEKILLVPFGYNDRVFHPPAPPDPENGNSSPCQTSGVKGSASVFTFLNISSTDIRKAQDILIRAFLEEFRADDRLKLIIKTEPFHPQNGRHGATAPWEGPDPVKTIDCVKERTYVKDSWPAISIVRDRLSDRELADLYRSADAFVIPSRSEGFGLTHLEAMACGIPVIATGWGGHRDFCLPNETFLLDYTMRPAGTMQYEQEIPGSMLAEPDIADTRKKMRWVVDHPALARKRAEKASRRIAGMTWDCFAEKLVTFLEEM